MKGIDILLMIEKGIKGEICHPIFRHTKANSKYMEIFCKTKGSLYLIYLDQTFYEKGMCAKLPVDGFE